MGRYKQTARKSSANVKAPVKPETPESDGEDIEEESDRSDESEKHDSDWTCETDETDSTYRTNDTDSCHSDLSYDSKASSASSEKRLESDEHYYRTEIARLQQSIENRKKERTEANQRIANAENRIEEIRQEGWAIIKKEQIPFHDHYNWLESIRGSYYLEHGDPKLAKLWREYCNLKEQIMIDDESDSTEEYSDNHNLGIEQRGLQSVLEAKKAKPKKAPKRTVHVPMKKKPRRKILKELIRRNRNNKN